MNCDLDLYGKTYPYTMHVTSVGMRKQHEKNWTWLNLNSGAKKMRQMRLSDFFIFVSVGLSRKHKNRKLTENYVK